MKKIFCLFLLVSATACGQSSADKIKSIIVNSKTSKHINIPGTRLYIVPPNNFKVATTYIGLQKGNEAMFNIYDLVGGNFFTNAATFSKEAFEEQGAKVFDYQYITVNGFQAKYIYLQADLSTKAHALVFGDTTFSTMIMTIYPVADEQTGKEIIRSLNTICYDIEKKINPLEVANFTLNENASRFKFLQYNANLYIYSIDGIETKEDKYAPMVLISQFPKDNTMTVKSIFDMMFAKIQQYGLTNPQIKNVSTRKINGYETYEAEIYGEMKGESSLLYYCVVANSDKAIAVQGIAKKDIQTNLQEFKKLAQTIHLK